MKSYGCCDPNIIGYVDLNGDRVWEGAYGHTTLTNYRGTSIIVVDPLTCLVSDWSSFDTWGDSSQGGLLNSYLQGLSDGAVIVGVTGDEPTSNLGDAMATLQGLGVEVSDVGFRGSFVFVAQKGSPTKTQQAKVLTESESVSNPAQMAASLSGIQNDVTALWLTIVISNAHVTRIPKQTCNTFCDEAC